MVDLPPLRDVIARHGLSARKALGQNFLLDANLTARIARSAGPLEEAAVYEIGPGPGGLTRSLLTEGARHVIAVERDSRCIEALKELRTAFPDRLTIHENDALKVEETSLIPPQQPVKIIANLPYNIATPLLIKWLSAPWPPWYQSLTLMFQKEVAERIVAKSGVKTYGRLSVISQWRANCRILFHIPARAFTPPPKVTSSVVQIIPAGQSKKNLRFQSLETVTAAAFGQRRKMLRSSLKTLGVNAAALLDEVGIDGSRRAEELSVEEFCRLALAFQEPSRIRS